MDRLNSESELESIFPKVVGSGFWVFLGNILNRILGVIRTIVLARLLLPSDFGLFGIGMFALGALDRFTQIGIEEALIQRKDDIKKYLNTGWSINATKNLIIFGIIFLFAPYAALFFRNAQVEPVIKVIALILILNGLSNIGIVYFTRELNFKKVFIHKVSGNIADFVVAISMALIFKNVWALVCGLLAGHYVRFVISYMIHPYRPAFRFDYRKALELFRFGGWLFGIGIIGFLSFQGDDAVVGRVLGATSLGFYYLAFMISNLPATEISWLVSRVTFPAYSKFQDNTPRLRESFLRVLQMTAFISIPLGIGLLLLAPEFTRIFLGEKWTPIIIPLQILTISGIVTSVLSTGNSLFLGSGKPQIEFKIDCVKLIILAVIIYPLIVLWGITGTALAVVFSSIAILPIWFYESVKVIKAKPIEYLKILFPIIIGSVIMFFGVILLKVILHRILITEFALVVLLGIFLYLGTIYLIWKAFRTGPFGEVKAFLSLI